MHQIDTRLSPNLNLNLNTVSSSTSTHHRSLASQPHIQPGTPLAQIDTTMSSFWQSQQSGYQHGAHGHVHAKTQRATNDVRTGVANLVDLTRRLLDGLQRWAAHELVEDEISNIYVLIGNEFHVTMAAFSCYGIGTADIANFPHDLRTVLEECLSEEACQSSLDRHLPRVRQIVAVLLQGLRNKQPLYWNAVQRSGAQ